MALKLFSRRSNRAARKAEAREAAAVSRNDPSRSEFVAAEVKSLDEDPLRRMFQQGRHAAILREEVKWKVHPGGEKIIRQAEAALEERMALVPAGSVTIATTLAAQPGSPEVEIEVEPVLFDIHTVTNSRFQLFVDAEGYDALEFWPEEIWPHLIELKDQTGQPAPRFWRNARHNTLVSEHPVVGISWFEAQAYSLWIGQRLPTEAEWQMAGSWHIKSSTDIMRRFPWGDAMDAERCNIWASRHRTTVPVTEYPTGAAPNQVLQLVGNVWEWTDTEFTVTDETGGPILGEMPMHVVRGGAFDTYFEGQGTTAFGTGQLALARSTNTGFRCAMDLQGATWMNRE